MSKRVTVTIGLAMFLAVIACQQDAPVEDGDGDLLADAEADAAAEDVADADLADGAAGDAPRDDDAELESGTDVDGDPDPDESATDAPDADAVDVGTPDIWRSALYPDDWAPGVTDAEGRFVHDFSYAGYHYGEVSPGTILPALTIDAVAAHGADPSGESDSTDAIQAALDEAAAAGGGVVTMSEGLYRLDGTLRVTASNVVLQGDGAERTRLYFTQSDGLSFASHLTFAGDLSSDLEVALSRDAANRTAVVEVADAGELAVGDDVALGWAISEAFVAEHGMTGTWQAFNDTWQPFFWRTIVAIDRSAAPHRVTLDVPLRYRALVRDAASLRRQVGTLTECGVRDLGLANAVAWEAAWAQDQVHVLELSGVSDCWVEGVASFASPLAPAEGQGAGAHLQSSGILIRWAKRVTVADSRMSDAQHRGSGGNGYLFEVRQSSEILFADNVARRGRHNFIQNWGFGATGIVWLRVDSAEGEAFFSDTATVGFPGLSEFHHSLATANLIDSSRFDDGWSAINRHEQSTGAGHTATQSVFWNVAGSGLLLTAQYGHGYVVGTAPELDVSAPSVGGTASGTAPRDWVEGEGLAATLVPPSLYEDQLRRRLAE